MMALFLEMLHARSKAKRAINVVRTKIPQTSFLRLSFCNSVWIIVPMAYFLSVFQYIAGTLPKPCRNLVFFLF
jgi:hypothetical protein